MGLGHISYGSGNARYIEVKKSVVAQPKRKTATPSDGGKSPGKIHKFIVKYCIL